MSASDHGLQPGTLLITRSALISFSKSSDIFKVQIFSRYFDGVLVGSCISDIPLPRMTPSRDRRVALQRINIT